MRNSGVYVVHEDSRAYLLLQNRQQLHLSFHLEDAEGNAQQGMEVQQLTILGLWMAEKSIKPDASMKRNCRNPETYHELPYLLQAA